MQRIMFFLLLGFAPMLQSEEYRTRLGFVHLDSARQSQIEASAADRERPFSVEKADEEDRFGEVAASPNSQNLNGFGIIAASAESEACGKEIDQIDKQILKLEQQKKVHQDLARKYQKDGDEWKYRSGSIHDAYANWGRAAEERKKAIDFQNQVDALLERRSRIIQFYPELYKPAP